MSEEIEDSEESEIERENEKIDIGRIGENFTTNFLLLRGFLVTHLDKGTRGVSANADLLVASKTKPQKHYLVQVKSSVSKKNPPFSFFIGKASEELDNENFHIYNSKDGCFRADIIYLVSIHPETGNYNIFFIPTVRAESLIIPKLREFYSLPTKSGGKKKIFGKIYLSLNPDNDSKSAKNKTFHEVVKRLQKYRSNIGVFS